MTASNIPSISLLTKILNVRARKSYSSKTNRRRRKRSLLPSLISITEAANQGMIMKLGLSEILQLAAKEKVLSDKIKILHKHDSNQLRLLLKYVLAPKVKWWSFLEGPPPPYVENKFEDSEGRLYADLRILYMF